MKFEIVKLLPALFVASLMSCASHTDTLTKASPVTDPLALDVKIPLDPKITKGRFDNGLTYYIRRNQKPEKRAELRLVVNAGSVLENDDQQGLAHFLEHMAFNGTANFKKQEIINFMESSGMRFGSHLNAYTGFDETVYMLTVPTDRDSLVEKGFQVLADWAANISLEDEEIEKERGVIREEWRQGRGANARIRDKEFPIMFRGSKYAKRLPIGQIAVIDTFHYETLRNFYRTWYRPDQMAVIAVGDFDETRIRNLVGQYFSKISQPKNAPTRPLSPVPDHQETLYSIQSDPEFTRTVVRVLYKLPLSEVGYVRDYRRNIVEDLYNGLLNKRLDELTKAADPPFLQAVSQKGSLVRTKDSCFIGAVVKDNGAEKGLNAILTEIKRVRQYGFQESELRRMKTQTMRNMEQAFRERDKFYSDDLAEEYKRNFLENESAPGIEYEYELYKKYLPGIALDEINALSGKWITDRSRVILVSSPEKSGAKNPTEAELAVIFDAIDQKPVEPYVDQVADRDLVEILPPPGQIVGESRIDSLGVTELVLNNGVKVIVKPTDFQNDEILVSAFSPGGTSLVPDSNYIAAVSAVSIINESGVGGFNKIELNKKLTGKVVTVQPFLTELTENLKASASPEDLETMFQLIYLYFTASRADSSAYLAYLGKMKDYIANRAADPATTFGDTINVTLAQHHFRARPWSAPMLNEMGLQKSDAIFKDRFADAGDFTFFVVGNVQIDSVKQKARQYLATLPTRRRNESWRDIGMRTPTGIVRNEVHKGLEKQSMVQITFSGPFVFNRPNRFELMSVADILRIRLREQIREEKGGTYGVRVSQSTRQYPVPEYRFTIQFGCNPERVEELIATVFQEIEKLKSEPVSAEDLNKIKEIDLRTYETNLKENKFWLETLYFYYLNNENPGEILNYPRVVNAFSQETLREAAKRYLPADNYVRVVLYPEK